MNKIYVVILLGFILLLDIKNVYPKDICSLVYSKNLDYVYIIGRMASISTMSKKIEKTIFVFNKYDGKLIKKIDFNNAINSIAVSNSGNVAVVCRSNSVNSEGLNYISNQLFILDRNFKTITSINSVTDDLFEEYFEWDSTGDRLVYLTSDPELGETSGPAFSPNGVWIYDVGKMENTKIAKFGTDVRWGRDSQTIFIRDGYEDDDFSNIYIYNLKDKYLSKTKFKGIKFSFDNKYYIGSIVLDDYGSREFIFKTNDNEHIWSTGEGGKRIYELLMNSNFINETNYILTNSLDKLVIYDIAGIENENNIMIRKDNVSIVGYSSDYTNILIKNNDGVFCLQKTLTGEVMQTFVVHFEE